MNLNEILHKIDEIESNLVNDYGHGENGELHFSVIDSCEENVRDRGIREEHDLEGFWDEVLSLLLVELDARGYTSAGVRK